MRQMAARTPYLALVTVTDSPEALHAPATGLLPESPM
jgi:hypothetical protein